MADTLTFTSIPLLYATCGGLPMESTTKKCLFTSVADTVAAGEGHWTSHPFLPGTTLAIVPIVTMHADTDDDAFPALIEGDPSEIQTQMVEVTNGTTLAGLSDVRYTAVGW